MARLIAGTQVTSTDIAKQGSGTLVLNGASQSLVGANKDRVALILTAPAAAVSLSLGSANAAANQGITIPPNQIFQLLGYTGPVQIIGTNTQVVSFAEI